jgi:hypothetical protein
MEPPLAIGTPKSDCKTLDKIVRFHEGEIASRRALRACWEAPTPIGASSASPTPPVRPDQPSLDSNSVAVAGIIACEG